ncbi:MAG: hypothetical protein KDI30_06410, partial [Pseudomonadales bacterium]|nr:hypothetical protein [Pseudomonadales bacterium]
LLFFIIFFVESLLAGESAGYIGSQQCAACHQQEYQLWRESDHRHAMAESGAESVLADFDTTTNFHDIKTRFFKKNGAFFANTLNEKGEYQDYPVLYTLGYYPLQQYLIDKGDGHIQALNVAWDSRSAQQGGQRWFHLQADEPITKQHPFFWAGHFQNWNSRCAECHVTGYEKIYDAHEKTYRSRWAEAGVACESCHGAGSRHREKVLSGEIFNSADKGFELVLPESTLWKFSEEKPIALADGKPQAIANNSKLVIGQCGACHSRRQPVNGPYHNSNYHDNFKISLLEQGLYFPDGQMNDEVFVLGSFLQSKMHNAGVNCLDCHNAHSGKPRITGNGLCLQCHKPAVFNGAEHHHHKDEKQGGACVDCHMPERMYMQVDARRDHKFVVPRPGKLSGEAATSPCLNCHSDRESDWVEQQLVDWGVASLPVSHWAHLNAKLQHNDNSAIAKIHEIVQSPQLPDIQKATLLPYLGDLPTRKNMQLAIDVLGDSDALVRRSAVTALSGASVELQLRYLPGLLDDPVRQVRFEAARYLSALPVNGIVAEDRLQSVLDEYQAALLYSNDTPSGLTELAGLSLNGGDAASAEQYYLAALDIEPHFIPAMLNLADLYRGESKEADAGAWLLKAVDFAPESAAVRYSYGLYLIRLRKHDEALEQLRMASELADATPQYVYAYAVALESSSGIDAAIAALKKADKKWPDNYRILYALLSYLDKSGRVIEAGIYRQRFDNLLDG